MLHPAKAPDIITRFGVLKLLKSMLVIFPQLENIKLIVCILFVSKFSKLTDFKDMQSANIFSIVITSFASLLLRFTDSNEVHPSKKDCISVTDERSKFLTSIVLIVAKFLNIELQEVN